MPAEAQTCQGCASQFTLEPDDVAFLERMQVSPPTLCPACRYQRRAANRNEWSFYKRACSLCNQEIVSIYNSDYPGPIYCQTCWWSDKWDPISYGRDFDFSRPFFEQFQELRLRVPHIALARWGGANSEYTNQSLDNKNCYLCVASSYNEDCMYGQWFQKSRECMDCLGVTDCELAYECSKCSNCSNIAFCEDCENCLSSYFLIDCRGCTSCFGCVGLRGKSYCWFNEQITKEEYSRRLSEFRLTPESIRDTKQNLRALALKYPRKYFHGNNVVHSKGDYLGEAKSLIYVFNAIRSENLRYCQDADNSKDSMDCTEVFSEFCYEVEGVEAQRSIGLSKCVGTFDSYYSELIFNSNNVFGCVSLRQKEYCIFNKQYSKEEYNALRDRIIAHMKKGGEWGEFFPIANSLFSYNETVAQDYFPLTKQEALDKGFRWYQPAIHGYASTVSRSQLPDTIGNTTDAVLKEVIRCSSQESEEAKRHYARCASAFRITENELRLYRKMGIPIPEQCYACRRQDRMESRNPRKLWARLCVCVGQQSQNGVYRNTARHFHAKGRCPNEFETSYAPDRPEIVYCEQCYQAEVV